MMKQIVYFFFLILFNNIQNLISTKSKPNYHRYLEQFGYLPIVQRNIASMMDDGESPLLMSISDRSGYSESPYREGIKTFQRLYKLNVTGELDEKTKELMERPRCGNPDVGTVGFTKQSVDIDRFEPSLYIRKRSATQISSWPKRHLTWFIEEYPKQQKHFTSHDHIHRVMNDAFHDWEKYSGLKFEMVHTKETADLKLKFYTHDHGDEIPFDGPGITLAHAFYPTAGEIHFDDDEVFTDNYKNKDDEYTLRLIAAHEIGHALGLTHSFEENSLMFPGYLQFDSNYSISNDDKLKIQELYGTPNIEPTTTTLPISTTTLPISTTTLSTSTSTRPFDPLPMDNWCPGDFQTGCEGPDGKLYLFKDNQVWRYHTRRRNSWDPQPTLIRERFPSITDTTISACVKSKSGYTYLFRNSHMWKLKTHWSADGPHKIHGKHYPKNPRIALFHQNSIYLIRNRLVYRLNEFNYNKELERHAMDSILHPPPNEFIQSGFTYAKRHYIFTSNQAYVYDSTDGNLLSGYPKPLQNGWFACQTASQYTKLKMKTARAYHKTDERDNHHPHEPK